MIITSQTDYDETQDIKFIRAATWPILTSQFSNFLDKIITCLTGTRIISQSQLQTYSIRQNKPKIVTSLLFAHNFFMLLENILSKKRIAMDLSLFINIMFLTK